MNFFKEEPSVLHVYQNTVGGALLFYSPIDYLVFYSVFSVCVRQFRVKILGLCLMVDHIHVLFAETDLPRIRRFMQSCTSRYSRSFNNSLGKGGPLFNEGFGRAAKRGMKKIRTAIAYLYNNPVEKKLCSRVEEYRWNFLAFATSDHPFSERIQRKHSRKFFRKALAEIDSIRAADSPLNETCLKRIIQPLTPSEREQLYDYIIFKYSAIDYKSVIAFYGDYERMILAINSNTGSEYDIHENTFGGSDHIFYQFSSFLKEKYHTEHIKDLLRGTEKEKQSLYRLLRNRFPLASRRKVWAFLGDRQMFNT